MKKWVFYTNGFYGFEVLCKSGALPINFSLIFFIQWYTEANYYCPDAPIILVGTELHLKNNKETIDEMRDKKLSPITYEQGLQMMKKIGAVKYLECSAKTHVGVQEVFDEAIRAVIHPTPIKKTDKRTSSNNAACTML